MKKVLSFLLAITLYSLIGMTAFAAKTDQNVTVQETDTTVQFTVASTYTVVIPESVTLAYSETTNNYIGIGMITVPSCRLENNEGLVVSIAASANYDDGFYMVTSQGTKQSYTIESDLKKQETGNGTVFLNDICAAFETSTTSKSVSLTYWAENPEFAGNYSNTLTFGFSVIEIYK